MRQQHYQAADSPPFRLTGGDELVDDHLRAVGEVAKLRLPDHQLVRLGGRIAVLETQHGLLGKDRIDDHKIALVLGDIVERDMDAGIPALAVLVVQHRVAVRKGTATSVLPGKPNVVAVGHEGGVRKRLGHAPVDRQLALAHLLAGLEQASHGGVHLEPFRQRGQRLGQPLQLRERHVCVGGIGPLCADEGRPVDCELALEVRQHRVGRVLAGIEVGAELLDDLVRLLGLDHALRDQFVGIQLAGARVLDDLLVHQRLGDERLVLLVVAELPEADHVNHDILLELLAEVERELGHILHRLRVVGIDVEDRCLDHLRDICAIDRGTRITRVRGREADLVVHDNVHRAARAVAARPGKV